jgi:hypothetical protein
MHSSDLGADSTANLFQSPAGKFSVEFRKISHVKFDEHMDIDQVDHIIYSVTFLNKSNSSKIETKYSDVYGWCNDKPNEVKDIYQSFIWSPRENFVILPEERWAGPPSSPYRMAINLNSKMNWSSAKTHIDIKLWADDFRVIGDSHDDGDYRVVLFNGKTGQMETIKSRGTDEYQFGYHVLSANKPIVLIEKIPDNYAGDAEHFIKECETLDANSMILTKIPCPKSNNNRVE